MWCACVTEKYTQRLVTISCPLYLDRFVCTLGQSGSFQMSEVNCRGYTIGSMAVGGEGEVGYVLK